MTRKSGEEDRLSKSEEGGNGFLGQNIFKKISKKKGPKSRGLTCSPTLTTRCFSTSLLPRQNQQSLFRTAKRRSNYISVQKRSQQSVRDFNLGFQGDKLPTPLNSPDTIYQKTLKSHLMAKISKFPGDPPLDPVGGLTAPQAALALASLAFQIRRVSTITIPHFSKGKPCLIKKNREH